MLLPDGVAISRSRLRNSSGTNSTLLQTSVEPISRYGVNSPSSNGERLPTGLPFRYDDVLESVAYEEGFPVISRFIHQNHFWLGQIQLPDKEFRYLRTVIVTAAVYRGLASKLCPKTNLSA